MTSVNLIPKIKCLLNTMSYIFQTLVEKNLLHYVGKQFFHVSCMEKIAFPNLLHK